MSRLLYFDCFAGIAGDMTLGALIDAGLPLEELRRALGSLAIGGYDVRADRVARAGVAATKFQVLDHPGHRHAPPRPDPSAQTHSGHQHDHHAHEHHPHDPEPDGHTHHEHRSLAEIERRIEQSGLSVQGKARAGRMFRRLAEVEAAIHQMPIEHVHLHEVGALDSIIDIVGTVFGLEWFGADRIVCSSLNVGGGTVKCSHGIFPVPAPATARLLSGVPIYSGGPQVELVTPTGALIATEYAESFGSLPPMVVDRIGYGAGDRDLTGFPNVLRVLVGRDDADSNLERVVVIECEIDDMNPQIFGLVMDRLHGAGALDVFYSAVQMKKGRPGTLMTILAPPERREALAEIVFRETTTIGLRFSEVSRERLHRETVVVETPAGTVRMKVAHRAGSVVNAAPEFDDCVTRARETGRSVKEVQALAMKAYLDGRREERA